MSEIPTITLNQGQQAAADGILKFLLGKGQELIISGGGGVGKTTLMDHVIRKVVSQYEDALKMLGADPTFDGIEVCATTNKASDVLTVSTGYPTKTIHSLLGLTVSTNFKTGETSLTRKRGATPVENKLIIIDECSMIDRQLYHEINALTINCKIIYVGDHCQLAPIKETLSPIYNQRFPFFNLTEPMRNSGQPALMALCSQFRDIVEGKAPFSPIKEVPGVIDHVSPQEMQKLMDTTFLEQNDAARILAYTNKRVLSYNDYIRQLRGLPVEYTVGEHLVINNAVTLPGGIIPVETEIEIISMERARPHHIGVAEGEDIHLESHVSVVRHKVMGDLGVNIPANYSHYRELKDYFKNQNNWRLFYRLSQTYPDLRPRDASTVHKAQGSTYDIVFVDLTDISTCTNNEQVARMLYVAVSRPRTRLVLFGELKERHGGPVIKA